MAKKLIIAAVAMAMGVAAHAASVDWSVNGAAAQTGYTVLLFVGAPASQYDTVAALKAAAISSATIAKSGRSYMTGKTTASGDAVTSSAKFYYAIISGDDATAFNYIEATGMAGNVYTPPATGTMYGSLTAANILAGASGKIGKEDPEPGTGPEPTTGLLLALGMAGLALRRRHA